MTWPSSRPRLPPPRLLWRSRTRSCSRPSAQLREQAETLRAAAETLGSTLSLSDVFELILAELRKVVPYRASTVQQLDGYEMVIVGGHGFPNIDELLGLRFDWREPDDPRPRDGRDA